MSTTTLRPLAAALLPPRLRDALSLRAWRTALAQASRGRRLAAAAGVVLILAGVTLRHAFFIVTPWNVMSESLPERWFFVWVAPSGQIERGDYVAFRWSGPGLAEGAKLIKRVAGLPGDTVTRAPAAGGAFDFYVNGAFAGSAKARSRAGAPLAPGPVGTLPPGYYYVIGTHPDSLDSRYALTGWVAQERLLGRAYPLPLRP